MKLVVKQVHAILGERGEVLIMHSQFRVEQVPGNRGGRGFMLNVIYGINNAFQREW